MLINENDENLIWSGVEEQQLTCSSSLSPLSPQLEQNLIQSPFNTGQILMSASTPASADTSIQQNKENTTTAITGTILHSKRLPKQCPLPPIFSKSLDNAIKDKKISGNMKLCLIREACEFYYSICPNPTPFEYQVMAQCICDRYPELKNKQTSQWCILGKYETIFRNCATSCNFFL